VRETAGSLQLVSWLIIGVGIGVLVLTWGRILAWIKAPERRPARIQRWGQDDAGYYFELTAPGEWSVEFEDGTSSALQTDADGSLRVSANGGRPVALIASDGARLPL
jgi:hypothetical protein